MKHQQTFIACCAVEQLEKGQVLYIIGEQPTSLAFIHKGLMCAYVIDKKGNEYNKNFLAEGRFPDYMSALLNNKSSGLTGTNERGAFWMALWQFKYGSVGSVCHTYNKNTDHLIYSLNVEYALLP